MEWHDWKPETFALARERGVPVFLFVGASWCRFCRELEARVLATPIVDALLSSRFVAIHVDKDRRPDLAERFSRGGWPTLAYLDDQGEAIASDGFLEPEALLVRLELVSAYWSEQHDAVRRRLAEASDRAAEEPSARAELAHDLPDAIAAALLESSDPVHGGWGARHKFPHPDALEFALQRWSRTGDEALRKLVLRTLRNMQVGEIHDRVDGGFYRFATARDWSGPHHEKVLDSNAQRLRVYVEASQALGEASFRDTAEGCIRFLAGTLFDPELGAFRGSQDADPVYAHLRTREARMAHGAPACDPTIFANWNALAVSALLRAGVVLERPDCTELALRALDFLVEELVVENESVHHYWDGTFHLPGLLTDPAHVLGALVDAAQYSGRSRYLRVAESVATSTVAQLAAERGGFWDTRHDPSLRGPLRRRERSLADNSRLAEALLVLSVLTRNPRWRDLARETLVSFAGDYRRHGPAIAAYGRAVDLYLHSPVHVVIVGHPDADDTRALQRAALAPYVASRVVQVIAPQADRDLLERLELPWEGGAAHAYVSRERESFAETVEPLRLPALMTRVEAGV